MAPGQPGFTMTYQKTGKTVRVTTDGQGNRGYPDAPSRIEQQRGGTSGGKGEERRQQYYGDSEEEAEVGSRQPLLSAYKRQQERARALQKQREVEQKRELAERAAKEQRIKEQKAQLEAGRQEFEAFENNLIKDFKTWLKEDIEKRRNNSWTQEQAIETGVQLGIVTAKYAKGLESYLVPNADESLQLSQAFGERLAKLLNEARKKVSKPKK